MVISKKGHRCRRCSQAGRVTIVVYVKRPDREQIRCLWPFFKEKRLEWAISRILYPVTSTGPWSFILGCRSPGTSCSLPGNIGRAALDRFPIWPCSGWGLPCLPCRHGSGELLPRHFTLTTYVAVYFLWHFP